MTPPLVTPQRAQDIVSRYGHLSGEALLQPLITTEFAGSIALVSSFGTEAAVLLHMVAAIDPSLPVLFIDTGKHFDETLRYRDALAARLGLTDIRCLRPDAAEISDRDPDGMLWQRDPDGCCALRKVEPLAGALDGFAAWISGRKRFQGGLRARLQAIESADGRVKINPLANWSAVDIQAAFATRDLPRHPLYASGFLSVGCMPCTTRVRPDTGDTRSGRWAGAAKTECGIHLALGRSPS